MSKTEMGISFILARSLSLTARTNPLQGNVGKKHIWLGSAQRSSRKKRLVSRLSRSIDAGCPLSVAADQVDHPAAVTGSRSVAGVSAADTQYQSYKQRDDAEDKTVECLCQREDEPRYLGTFSS